jgi:hypothetical protein
MGSGALIKCKNCDYEFQAMEGIGFMFGNLMNVIEFVPKKERAIILEYIDKFHLNTHLSDETNYYNRLYINPKTGTLYCLLYVELRDPLNNELIYKTKYLADKSNVELKPITVKRILRKPCPKCHQTTLYEEDGMLWD